MFGVGGWISLCFLLSVYSFTNVEARFIRDPTRRVDGEYLPSSAHGITVDMRRLVKKWNLVSRDCQVIVL